MSDIQKNSEKYPSEAPIIKGPTRARLEEAFVARKPVTFVWKFRDHPGHGTIEVVVLGMQRERDDNTTVHLSGDMISHAPVGCEKDACRWNGTLVYDMETRTGTILFYKTEKPGLVCIISKGPPLDVVLTGFSHQVTGEPRSAPLVFVCTTTVGDVPMTFNVAMWAQQLRISAISPGSFTIFGAQPDEFALQPIFRRYALRSSVLYHPETQTGAFELVPRE